MRGIAFAALLQCLASAQPSVGWAALFGNSTILTSAVDAEGNIYVAGTTLSASLPVTPNALGPVFIRAVCGFIPGPHGTPGTPRTCEHGFAAKIDPTGTRVLYATYIGGELQDGVTDLALDTHGNVYLLGNSTSTKFPVTADAYQATGRGFLMKLNADGSKALYSTRLPGITGSFARADGGTLYIPGFISEDQQPNRPYLLKVTNEASSISRVPLGDSFSAPKKVDEHGNLYFADSGVILNDPSQVTISKRDSSGKLIYAATFGGSGADYVTAMDIDTEGSVYFIVDSRSLDFPRTAGAAPWGGVGIYVGKLSPDGKLIYSTLIIQGYSSATLKVGENGHVFVSGRIYGKQLVFGSSVDPDCYPFQGGEQDVSWFSYAGGLSANGETFRFATGLSTAGILFLDSQGRYRVAGRRQLVETGNPFNRERGIHCVNNSASKRKGPIAPGQLITLHGSGIEGAAVYINGVLAPVLETGVDRIDAVVPFSLETQSPATIHLLHPGNVDFPEFIVPAAEASPGAYSRDGSGYGLLALWNEDGSPNSAEFPAPSGSVVRFYVTGLGMVDPAPQDGAISQEKYATKPRLVPDVRFISGLYGSRQAEIVYCGSAPGKVEGITQIEVRIPESVPGDQPYFLQLNAGLAELSNSPGLQVYLRTR